MKINDTQTALIMAIETHGNEKIDGIVKNLLNDVYNRKQEVITELLKVVDPDNITDRNTLQKIMEVINN